MKETCSNSRPGRNNILRENILNDPPLRVILVNKSDQTGGAAVVSFRLMMALRSIGVDARMIVAEKLTDSPYVKLAAGGMRLKTAFLADRLPIAVANGFDRATLFKLDGAFAGIDISSDEWVKEADAVLLNWINQGLLSLKDIQRLICSGKQVIWTMHDMWNMTGLCHHAGACGRYEEGAQCGQCPFLGKHAAPHDLSHKVWHRKQNLYSSHNISFVAVSRWLAEKARRSSLLSDQHVEVIPNAFPLPEFENIRRTDSSGELRLIFGAARLDDDVKGFPIFIASMEDLQRKYPHIAARTKVLLYGGIRDSSLIEKIPVKTEYAGVIKDSSLISGLYQRSDIVVSTSLFETLPGTLIEGQAYGCFPIAFGRGGQRDIIDNGLTGIIAEWDDDVVKAGENIAEAIVAAEQQLREAGSEIRRGMYDSVRSRFSASRVADQYVSLIRKGRGKTERKEMKRTED